jgi:hypothetical protein
MGREREGDNEKASKPRSHGDFVCASGLIGWLFSSSKGIP